MRWWLNQVQLLQANHVSGKKNHDHALIFPDNLSIEKVSKPYIYATATRSIDWF